MKRIFTAGFNGASLPYKYRVIEVAPTDASETIPQTLWGDMAETIGYLTDDLYAGGVNTAIIHEQDTTEDKAADIAAAYTYGGKTDWYLPSIDELQLIYDNISLIPDISTAAPYWSSSEVEGGKAPSLNMLNGVIANDFKAWFRRVRPVRSYYTNNLPILGRKGKGKGIIVYIEELHEIQHEINIYDRDANGDDAVELLLMEGAYELSWNSGTTDVVIGGIIESECSINIQRATDPNKEYKWRAFLNSLPASAEQRYIVEIIRDEKLWWFGILLPDFSSIVDHQHGGVTLSAVDGLSYLQNIEASDLNHVDQWIGSVHTWEHLNDLHYFGILGDILYGLNKIPTADLFWKQTTDEDRETKFLYVNTDWFGQGMLETDEPLEKAFIKPYQGTVAWGRRSTEAGFNGTEITTTEWMTYHEVINHILTRFKAVLVLQEGAWYIVQREVFIDKTEVTYHTYRRHPNRIAPAVPDWTAIPSTVNKPAYKAFGYYGSHRKRAEGEYNYLPGLLKAKVKYIAGDEVNTDSLVPVDYKPGVEYTTIPLETGTGNFMQIKVGFTQAFGSPSEFPTCGFFRVTPRYKVSCKVGSKWWNGTAWQSTAADQIIEGTRLEYSAELYGQSEIYSSILPQDSGVQTTLYGMQWTDINTGWACGANGVIRRTQNAGETIWTAIQSGVNVTLRGLHFPSFYVGYVVGYGGKILKTSNGATFIQLNSGTTANLNGVFFLNNSVGWVVGNNGVIRRTTNGGMTWTNQTSNTTYSLYSIYFIDGGKGWACGEHGTICKTTDGGATWTVVDSDTVYNLNSIKVHTYSGTTYIMAVGDNGTVVIDSGSGFVLTPVGTTNNLYNIWGFSGLYNPIRFICGGNGTVLKTENNGTTWTEISATTDEELYAVQFMQNDMDKGYAAGSSGTIINTLDAGQSWIIEADEPTINEALTSSTVQFEQNTTDIPENGVCVFKVWLYDFVIEYVQHGSTLTFTAYPTIQVLQGEHHLLYIVNNEAPANWVEYEATNENEDFNLIYEEQDSMFGSAQTVYGNYITPVGAKWGKGFSSDKNLYFNQVLVEEILQNQNHPLLFWSGNIYDRSSDPVMPIQPLQFGYRGWIYRFFLNQITYNPRLESYTGDWVEISRGRLRIAHTDPAVDNTYVIDISPATPTETLPRVSINVIELNKVPRIKQLHVIPKDTEALFVDENGTLTKKSADGTVMQYKSSGGCSINDTTIGGVKVRIFIDEILNVPEWYHYNTLELRVDGDLELFGELNLLDIPQGGSPTPSVHYIRKSAIDGLIWYGGFAIEGSLESEAVWTIFKIVTLATGGVVSNTEFTNKKWTERNLL